MLDELELKQRYNDYLREVQQEQLYQQVKAKQSNWQQGILVHLGNLLITLGHQLKEQNLFPTKSSTSNYWPSSSEIDSFSNVKERV